MWESLLDQHDARKKKRGPRSWIFQKKMNELVNNVTNIETITNRNCPIVTCLPIQVSRSRIGFPAWDTCTPRGTFAYPKG